MFINTSEDLSRVFEHASSVAPVVSTSSTRSICYFSKAFGSVTEKTFSTLAKRSVRLFLVCDSV